MNDYTTLCCIGALLMVFFLMLIPRMLGGLFNPFGVGRGMRRGPLYPEADDPDIESRGSFGLPRRRSSFGGRADSPNIRSRGGFGRSKR